MKVFLFIVVWFILVAMPVIWAMTHNISDIAIVWFIAAFLLPSIGLVIVSNAMEKPNALRSKAR